MDACEAESSQRALTEVEINELLQNFDSIVFIQSLGPTITPVEAYKAISHEIMKRSFEYCYQNDIYPFKGYAQLMCKVCGIPYTISEDGCFHYVDDYRYITAIEVIMNALNCKKVEYNTYSIEAGGWQHDNNNMITHQFDDIAKSERHIPAPINTFVVPKSSDDTATHINEYFGPEGIFTRLLNRVNERERCVSYSKENDIVRIALQRYMRAIANDEKMCLNETFKHCHNIPSASRYFMMPPDDPLVRTIRDFITFYIRHFTSIQRILCEELPPGMEYDGEKFDDPGFKVVLRDVHKTSEDETSATYRACLKLLGKDESRYFIGWLNLRYNKRIQNVSLKHFSYARFNYRIDDKQVSILFKPGVFAGRDTNTFFNVGIKSHGLRYSNPMYDYLHSDDFYNNLEITQEKLTEARSHSGMCFHLMSYIEGHTWEDALYDDEYRSAIIFKNYERMIGLPRFKRDDREGDSYFPVQNMSGDVSPSAVEITRKLVELGLCESEMSMHYIWKFSYFFGIDIKKLIAEVHAAQEVH